jgi:hypothetical protein
MLAHAGAADETLSVVMLFGALWLGWAGWSRLKNRGLPRLPRNAAIALVAGAVVLAVAALIVPRALFPNRPPSAAGSGPRPSSTATLSIEQPTPGEVISGDELEVVLTLPGGTIVDAANRTIAPDTGHIHLSLDGAAVSMTYGLVQVVSIADLEPGAHTLTAEFVAADHAPFDPRVESTVLFTKSHKPTGGPP